MRHLLLRGDAGRIPLPDRSCDLVIGSPPYTSSRLYLEGGRDLGIARGCIAWVEWMLGVTAEALRVSRGPVLWVVAGKTEDWCYQPAPEGLLWEWWRRGGECHCFRPCYWHRYGIPGSGQKQWYRADVEYVLCFKRPGKLPHADPTANGHIPKFGPGGEMSHRMWDGKRVNGHGVRRDGVRIGARRVNGKRAAEETPDHALWVDPRRVDDDSDFVLLPDEPKPVGPDINQWGGHATTGRSRKADGTQQAPGRPSHRSMKQPNGTCEPQAYEPPVLADPGNLLSIAEDGPSSLIHTGTGGNSLGSKLAHESEAPYPEDVPEFFINSHCPPGGLVLDPFSGSGTTVAAALKFGRRGIGLDLRQSQCRLARRRLRTVTPGLAFDREGSSLAED